MEAYGDVTISCIINIASLTIGVISPIVVWKTGFFDKVEEKNKVSEEPNEKPNEKLGKKQPSVQYDQYDNDDLYEQEKPEKKMDNKEKTNSYYGTNDEDYYKDNYTKSYDA